MGGWERKRRPCKRAADEVKRTAIKRGGRSDRNHCMQQDKGLLTDNIRMNRRKDSWVAREWAAIEGNCFKDPQRSLRQRGSLLMIPPLLHD